MLHSAAFCHLRLHKALGPIRWGPVRPPQVKDTAALLQDAGIGRGDDKEGGKGGKEEGEPRAKKQE
eukprot:5990926-Alexandrium_andersonii.AAC.1